ncbi:MAG: DUF58 domain-containing protein [Chloroflexota bacterium]|nr:DUF58 domain-containing protein [Chloroflexota bacterium]
MALGARSRSAGGELAPPKLSAADQLEAMGVVPPVVATGTEGLPPAVGEIHLQKPALPVLAVALFFLALVAGVPILYYLFYAILALIVITFVWTRSLVQNLAVNRVLRTKWCLVGDSIQEDFVMRNDGRLPALWVEVRDESTIPHYHPGVVESLGGLDERRWSARAICRRRGLFKLGPVRVLTGDPFGIFQGAITYPTHTSFIVYPPLIELPGLPMPSGTAAGTSRTSLRTLHVTTDASGIREYAPGDSLHRIHWLSIARLGSLRSKEYDLEPSGNLWIILDLEAAVHAGEDEESTEEYAVKIAGALIHQAIRDNKAVGLVAYGAEKTVVPPGKGAPHLWRLMEQLALVAADGRLPLHRVMTDVSATLGKGLSVVVITPSTDTTWLNSLLVMRNRTAAPVVILLDQASFGGPFSTATLANQLLTAGLTVHTVKRGQEFRSITVEKREWEQQHRGRGVPGNAPVVATHQTGSRVG